MTSGFSFFAATFGVAWYSKVDMIGAICTLLSRGALISMACVIFILPAMFIIFDKVICKTSIDFLGEKSSGEQFPGDFFAFRCRFVQIPDQEVYEKMTKTVLYVMKMS